MSGSSGTSGSPYRRTTTGKVWGTVAVGPAGLMVWLALDPCVTPCRLQHTVTLLQQQCEEHRLLLQTLRAELHVYESLPGPSAKTRAGTGLTQPPPPALCPATSLGVPGSSANLGQAQALLLLQQQEGHGGPAGK